MHILRAVDVNIPEPDWRLFWGTFRGWQAEERCQWCGSRVSLLEWLWMALSAGSHADHPDSSLFPSRRRIYWSRQGGCDTDTLAFEAEGRHSWNQLSLVDLLHFNVQWLEEYRLAFLLCCSVWISILKYRDPCELNTLKLWKTRWNSQITDKWRQQLYYFGKTCTMFRGGYSVLILMESQCLNYLKTFSFQLFLFFFFSFLFCSGTFHKSKDW